MSVSRQKKMICNKNPTRHKTRENILICLWWTGFFFVVLIAAALLSYYFNVVRVCNVCVYNINAAVRTRCARASMCECAEYARVQIIFLITS